ncbi:Host specificity protein J of prophage [Escherichia coli]|uniref:phage tail tip fiber protein n=1 Tax=Escherichia coli TaxID=562 RepID=UPI0006A2314A|nr:phage tail protein [Escherichia coli]CTU77034.1 Host specificity protein J of prophage [Escherichia coli]CTV97367.1 Host specificity protein J of prophage [Escherichia coli]CTX36497.1 Host specificity protein J of prophage [Escherichia coli]CTX68840.1 Host specificity protein J of prophage [Escherichia coli]CTY55013.1 Host specificity protein J of prophage [Escherichia coli]
MSSGGGKAKTPTLLNDNLFHKQFYRVLDILSEGPIYGPVNQKAPLNSVMLNDTPITGSDGSTSVPGVSVAWRNGTADQSPINGFNAIESTVIVNAKVTHDTPIIRTVSDPNVNRVRLNLGVDSLVQSDDKGNQYNTSVTLMVDVKPSSSTTWSLVKDIHIGPGKQSGEYLEAHIIKAPDEKPFDIRVRRVTPDSTGDLLHNDTRWSSYSEIIDDNLSYPHTAVAGAVIDHDQYTDTPTRTYHMRGLIVDVPDNYDPETRTYSGLWLGGFKKAYTNNPAWLFRYLVKNERFGLARHAGYIDVDDGALYTLSQYCDQLVNDGYGGLEPRMTLNAYITEQMSARDLLDNIAGMFRGIALWDGQRLTVMIDAPQDPIATITNANVVDGAFTRSSIARAESYNAVIVSWTDPENGWEQSKEYVADDELIARDGYNETTLEAFGCTSRGQAYRAGKWLIETAKREPSKFTFKMARDAIHFTPGDIIEILDNNRAGARLGGRIVANNGKVITVDKVDSDLVAAGDTISLLDSDGKFKKHQITGVNGNNITLAEAPAWIRNGTVFAVSTESAKPVLCRITSVAETENNSVYTIEAAQHDPHKQAVVDEGAIFEVNNDTLNHFRVPNIENLKVLNVGSETVQCRATWETQTTTHRLTFEIRVYNADGRVVATDETTNYRYDFYGLDAGSYTLGIRGRNDTGMKGAESIVDLVIGAPAAPIGVNWVPGVFQATVYPISKTTLTTDTAYEFYYSGENQITDPSKVTTLAQFTGRGYQWTFGGMNTGHKYYVYVRTRNAFGVSDFVEASGKPTENFDEISDYVMKDVMESEQFKDMIGDIKDLGDRADLIESATNDLKNATDNLKTATDNLTNITDELRTDTDSLITETGEIKADTDTLKKETEDLYKKVGENTDGIGQHEVRIDSLEVSSERIDSELAQAKASLQNASLALINNSLAQTNTRVTLTAQYKKGQSETNAQIDRIDNVIAEEKRATAESLKTITAEMNTMDSNLKGQISSVERAVADESSARAEAINNVNASIADLDKKTDASVNRLDQAIADESSARAQAISGVNASISNLESKTDASVSRLDKAISDETQARSDAITEVKADLTTLESNTNASVSRLDKAIADETSARSEAVSDVNASISALDKKTAASVKRLDQAIADETSARSEAISGVNASINTLESNTESEVSRLDQAIADEASARAQAISGVNASISTLDGKVTSNVTRIDKAIADETKARTDAISSLNSSLTSTINSKVSEVSTALSTHEASSAEKFGQISASFDSVNSSITEWSQAMATADEALSSKIDQLTVTVNGNTTAIETTSKALTDFKGNVDATYSIKLATDNNGMKYATGMSLGLTGNGTNVQSQCIFLVDRFVLMTAANGTYTTPFYVSNGAMYVKEAFIKNASIGTAKIADAAITMAKIVNEIKSSNYVAGSNGWRITKDGSSEFNNVVVRGEVHASSGKFSGSLEAKTFIGDVANMYTGSDVSRLADGVLEKTITYNDTSNAAHSRHICVMANVKGFGGCTIIIGSSEKSLSMNGDERLVMHSSSVTSRGVTVKIRVSAQNSRGAYINSPTVIVSRGSGSFSG